MQKFKRNSGIAFCVFIFLVLFHGASAQISGAQYKIYSPIVTFGAGEGSSQNYAFKELIGEIIAGITSGSSYRLRAGAVYRGVPEVISFSLSKNSMFLLYITRWKSDIYLISPPAGRRLIRPNCIIL